MDLYFIVFIIRNHIKYVLYRWPKKAEQFQILNQNGEVTGFYEESSITEPCIRASTCLRTVPLGQKICIHCSHIRDYLSLQLTRQKNVVAIDRIPLPSLGASPFVNDMITSLKTELYATKKYIKLLEEENERFQKEAKELQHTYAKEILSLEVELVCYLLH